MPLLFYFGLPDDLRQTAILLYQLLSQIGVVAVLVQHQLLGRVNHRPTWRSLTAAMSFFLCAEVSFNTSFLAGSVESYRHKFLGAFSYTLTFVCLATALLYHFGRRREGVAFWAAVSVIAAAHFALQHVFLLVPLREVYFSKLPWIMLPNGYAYSLATSVVTAQCVLYSLRSEELFGQALLQSLLALLSFDFAARYQVVQHQFQSTDASQALWAGATGAIFCTVFLSCRHRAGIVGEKQKALPMRSVRVLLGVFIFAMTMALVAALFLAGLAAIGTARHVTAMLSLLFFCWCASNILAVRISSKLRAIAGLMPVPRLQGAEADSLDGFRFAPVGERSMLFEIDEMIIHHNALVEGANGLLTGLVKKDREAATGRLAVQVAHDIRSPLSALTMAVQDLGTTSEEARSLMRSAMFRIEDIANQLLAHRRQEPANEDACHLLSAVIESLVSEKRFEFRGRLGLTLEATFGPESYGVFARVNLRDFKRTLSNLINNAAEALTDHEHGRVQLQLQASSDAACVVIRDNGRGIPPDVLVRLGVEEVTFGKQAGNGVGVRHAAECVRAWGGRLSFESEEGHGTLVRIQLPRVPAPRWFVETVQVKSGQVLVVVDDDASIHNIWTERVDRASVRPRLVHLSTPGALREWHRGFTGDALYMMDYEFLGHRETGLDLIADLSLDERAYLVTSRFEEAAVLQACQRLGVGMIPKPTAAYVPLNVVQDAAEFVEGKPIDLVLIDNDAMIRCAWEMQAKWKGKIIRTFASFDDFWSQRQQVSLDVPVYVDSDLGNGVKGEVCARSLKEVGYAKIYLATGFPRKDFEKLTWLSGVVGKEMPA